MTPSAIAAKVAAGFGKAGTKLGALHTVYRPTAATLPALDPANQFRQLPFIASATADGAFKRPGNWTAPEYFALLDARLVRSGDYLKGPSGTWFVATLEALAIPMVIECNDVVSVARSAGIQAGLNTTYGGRTTATDTALVNQWPASLIGGGHSEASRAQLPGDPKRLAGAVCKIPAVPGVMFREGDRITGQTGDTWMVAGAFLQSQGWRLELASVDI